MINILILIPALFGAWLAATSLTEVIPGLGLYDGKRMLELYLICLTLSVVLINRPARQKFNAVVNATPARIRLLLIIFFALGVGSALLTPNPAYPLTDVAMLFLMVITALCVACARYVCGYHFDRVVLIFIGLMGFGVVFQELIGLLVYLSFDRQFNYREALFHFLHPRLYNQIQTWTIPLLALLPMLFNKNRGVLFLSVFLLGAQWYILLSTGARGTTISLVLAMLVIGIVLPIARKSWLKIHVSGLLLGVLLFISVAGILQSLQPDKTTFVSESVGRPMLHTSGRTDLWKHAIEDVVQSPFLGSGPMRYACEADHYLAGSPHSFPLQIMGEWGVPAFLLLAILFGWLVFSWKQATKSIANETSYQQVAITCLSISCLAAIIHVCVSGLLIAPASQVAGILVSGWLLGCLVVNGITVKKAGEAGHKAIFLLLFGLITSVSVLLFATAELGEMKYRTSYAVDYGPITPRFWQDGRFCEYSF